MATTGQQSSTLQERVAARFDSLTATERRVARYLADHPQEAAFASAEELGRATGTSDASVVRTAKALGFDGLPGLKRSLQSHIETLLTPASRLQNTIAVAGSRPESLLATTLRDRAQVVEDIGQVLDPGEFRKAVELIAGAHETLVCGIAGLVLAEHAATRLTRVGYRARFVADSGVRLVDWLLPLGPDDVVLAIAHNRFVREVRVVFEHAHRIGAKVILVTETNRPSLTELADVVLSIPVGPVGLYGGQTPTLVVVEALSMAVAAQDEERSLQAFVTMNRLRRELEGDDRPEDEVIAPSRHNGKTPRKRLANG